MIEPEMAYRAPRPANAEWLEIRVMKWILEVNAKTAPAKAK